VSATVAGTVRRAVAASPNDAYGPSGAYHGQRPNSGFCLLGREGRFHRPTHAAIRFIESYDERAHRTPVERYEIEVRYKDGDRVRGQFKDKIDVIDLLRSYQPISPGTG
jgi:hypothetical protein